MSTSRFTLKQVGEPWLAFFRAADGELDRSAEIRCIGGFAMLLLLESARPTGDVDFIDAVPRGVTRELVKIAGMGSTLAADHNLYLQSVTVADHPCNYEKRLLDATPSDFARLKIKILDPYDLILTKVQRDFPRDRQDASSLISELTLDRDTLRRRFDEELGPYLAVASDRTSQTLDLWIEEFFPAGPNGTVR